MVDNHIFAGYLYRLVDIGLVDRSLRVSSGRYTYVSQLLTLGPYAVICLVGSQFTTISELAAKDSCLKETAITLVISPPIVMLFENPYEIATKQKTYNNNELLDLRATWKLSPMRRASERIWNSQRCDELRFSE